MRKLINTVFMIVILWTTSFAATSSFAGKFDDFQRWIDIVNLSDLEIYKVQITNIDDGDWGPDLLGKGVIEAFGEVRVEPVVDYGYCRFDALITYKDGSEVKVYDVNLCEVTDIYVDANGYWDLTYA